jgi:dolichol-phosphate mannosyltransferase
MGTMKKKYLMFIPVLNGGKTIKKVMLNLKKLKLDFDVLVVDNHSPDNTVQVVEDTIKEQNLKNYTVIKNIRNMQYGGSQKIALNYGIHNGYGKLIVIHADNQYPVNYIPALIKRNEKTKAAMTIGTRLKHKNVKKIMPKWRYLGNSFLSAMNRWAYNIDLDEFNSEFRVYDLDFMKKANFERWSNIAAYTIDSTIGTKASGGIINQVVVPCSYPPEAHHPSMKALAEYFLYNIYRALRFKLFKR